MSYGAEEKPEICLSTNLIENVFNGDILLTFLTTPYFLFQY